MSDAPLPSSFDGNEDFYSENRWQKFSRRLREEPLIPLGCILTCWALLGATRSMRAGDHQTTNRMFRRRIYAQGFTIAAMAAGSLYWQEDRAKRKEFQGLQAEKKRQEKRDAWLRELEARDEEDKAMKAKIEKRRGVEREAKKAKKEVSVTQEISVAEKSEEKKGEEKKGEEKKGEEEKSEEKKVEEKKSEEKGSGVVDAVRGLFSGRR